MPLAGVAPLKSTAIVPATSTAPSTISEAAAVDVASAAIESVAARLGNTPTICRKCYVHPEVLNAYVEGQLLLEVRRQARAALREELAQLKPEEAAVLAMLEARLKRTLEDSLQASLAAVKKGTKKRKG